MFIRPPLTVVTPPVIFVVPLFIVFVLPLYINAVLVSVLVPPLIEAVEVTVFSPPFIVTFAPDTSPVFELIVRLSAERVRLVMLSRLFVPPEIVKLVALLTVIVPPLIDMGAEPVYPKLELLTIIES